MKFLATLARLAGGLAIMLVGIWATLAMWYRLPFPEIARIIVCGVFIIAGLLALAGMFGRMRYWSLAVFAAAFAVIAVWWSTIEPPAHADWADDVARQVTGTIDGDMLTLINVRNFDWESGDEASGSWETRSYDMSTVRSLDTVMSYWAGPEMAHMIMSFGFEDGRYLAWSVEVRREKSGGFSPVADAFKEHALVIVAADERDVIGVRANKRGEDVKLYRLNTSPADARTLLVEYVRDANRLAAKPAFYNSLTTNCSTVVFKMMAAVGDRFPFDWRLIVNGYLPSYAYDRQALATTMKLDEIKARSHVPSLSDETMAGLSSNAYSARIRKDVPNPRD